MKGCDFINIFITILGIFNIYNIIYLIFNKNNFKLYKSKINSMYDSINNNLKFVFLSKNINNALRLKKDINKYLILFLLFLFIFSFIFIYKYLNVIIGSLLISIVIALAPYYICVLIEIKRKRKIINSFPNFLINLKSYCVIKNDIIEAFRRVVLDEPLQDYINKFNYLVKTGISVNECFEIFRNEINVKTLNNYIILLEHCYLNGGDFSLLLDKMSKILININIKKEKEIQNNFSTKLMLLIIIFINIIIVKVFIFDSYKYFNIITNTLVGKIILNINIITYLMILYVYYKLNNVEE